MRATRGARRTLVAVACSGAAAILLAACGDSRVELERPGRMIEISARIGSNEVEVAPRSFDAGKTSFTVLNMGLVPSRLSIDGPTPLTTDLIQPGETATLRGDMRPGSYEAVALGGEPLSPAEFTVGPKRESSDSVLLLP